MIVLFAVQLDNNCQLQLSVVKLNDECMLHHCQKLDQLLYYLDWGSSQRQLISKMVLDGGFYEHSAFNFTVILVNNTIVVV